MRKLLRGMVLAWSLMSSIFSYADTAVATDQTTPSQAQSKAPSPITPVYSIITNFTSYTGPFPYIMRTFTVGASGTHTVTLNSPSISNGLYILRGTFSPSTGTPGTPLSAFMKFSQQLTNTTYTVDLEGGQTYTALEIFSSGTSAVTLTISGPGCVSFSTTCGMVPPFAYMPYVQGVALPNVLDMGSGAGVSLNSCTLPALQQLLGGTWGYAGQNRNGQATYTWNGQAVSVFPLSSSSTANLSPAFQYNASNLLSLVTPCGTIGVAGVPMNLDQFGAALTSLGTQSSIDQNGVITIRLNGVVYVLRADLLIQSKPGSKSGISIGGAGTYSFTDSAGNMQYLRAAFLDMAALSTAVGGSLAVQLDGTVIQTIGGQRWLLIADSNLSSLPTDHNLDTGVWADGTNHFSYRISNVKPFPLDLFQFNYSQGFTRTLIQ